MHPATMRAIWSQLLVDLEECVELRESSEEEIVDEGDHDDVEVPDAIYHSRPLLGMSSVANAQRLLASPGRYVSPKSI